MPKILIADDEKIVRDIFVKFLANHGFSVFQAQDGAEALDKINNDNFDLLIMDLKMPKVKGPDILEAMRVNNKQVPTIILTGMVDASDSGELKKFGYTDNDILCKPVDLYELLAAVKNKLKL